MPFWPWKRKASAPPAFAGPDPSSPENFVLSFARDYKAWNDHCYDREAERPEDQDNRAQMAEFQTLYADWLAPYLAADVPLQLISYGSTATFDPDRISVSSVEDAEGGCRVCFTVTDPDHLLSNDFVADLQGDPATGWRLRQVYYVDPFPEEGEETLPYL